MTTIAWDGKTIAADRRSSYHGNPSKKLRRMKDGSVCGGAGESEAIRQAISFLDNDRDSMPSKGEQTILRVFADGRAEYTHELGERMAIELPYFAIGTGRDYAMGALAMGATAQQAVEIASRFDSDSGGGVDVLTPEMKSQ